MISSVYSQKKRMTPYSYGSNYTMHLLDWRSTSISTLSLIIDAIYCLLGKADHSLHSNGSSEIGYNVIP